MRNGRIFLVESVVFPCLVSVSLAQLIPPCNAGDSSPHTGWSNPGTALLENVNTAGCSEKSPDEDANGTALYFHRQAGCGAGNIGLRFSTRQLSTEAWGVPLPVLDSSPTPTIIRGAQPSISADGMTLYFSDNSAGQFDIWYATRIEPGMNSWTVQGPVGGAVNTINHDEKAPSIAANGTLLYFCRKPIGSGDHDIYRAWGGSATSFPYVEREDKLSHVGVDDLSPDVSYDYSYIVFDQGGENSMADGIYIASRDMTNPLLFPPRWCTPKLIANSDDPNAQDKSPCISAGNTRILFRSTRPLEGDTSSNIWVMTRPCQRLLKSAGFRRFGSSSHASSGSSCAGSGSQSTRPGGLVPFGCPRRQVIRPLIGAPPAESPSPPQPVGAACKGDRRNPADRGRR